MSEATHYWPRTQGPHMIEHPSDNPTEWVLILSDWGRRGVWHYCSAAFTEAEMIERGYLGVRREAEKPDNQAEQAEDNAATAREAKQELSMCRKPAEFERWAIKWGRTLCEIAGAS